MMAVIQTPAPTVAPMPLPTRALHPLPPECATSTRAMSARRAIVREQPSHDAPTATLSDDTQRNAPTTFRPDASEIRNGSPIFATRVCARAG
jgi:hypothetical protein